MANESIPKDTNSLPDLTEDEIDLIQDFEKRITSHFQIEREAFTKFFIAEDNLDNLRQSLAKSLSEIDDSTKQYLESLQNKMKNLESEKERVLEQRDILEKVNKNLIISAN